jgi:hypothetical protein
MIEDYHHDYTQGTWQGKAASCIDDDVTFHVIAIGQQSTQPTIIVSSCSRSPWTMISITESEFAGGISML